MTEELKLSQKDGVIDSSGDIFADLGLPHSEEDRLKVDIARIITLTIQRKEITQTEAARMIGTDQAKVSNLVRGRVAGFSVERMMQMLLALGRDIDIRVSDRSKGRPGRISVKAA